MYSDEWLSDESIRESDRIKINSKTDIKYWLNQNEQLVGVSVNFNFAEDVHYEFKADNWFRFLKEVLYIKPDSDVVLPFGRFLETVSPAYFGKVLDDKHIKYDKIAFLDW